MSTSQLCRQLARCCGNVQRQLGSSRSNACNKYTPMHSACSLCYANNALCATAFGSGPWRSCKKGRGICILKTDTRMTQNVPNSPQKVKGSVVIPFGLLPILNTFAVSCCQRGPACLAGQLLVLPAKGQGSHKPQDTHHAACRAHTSLAEAVLNVCRVVVTVL